MDLSDKRATTEANPKQGWFKSSYSSSACTCVEVRFDPRGRVGIRDSKYLLDQANCRLDQPVIMMSMATWERLSGDLLTDQSNVVAGSVEVRIAADGSATFHCLCTGVILAYDANEVAAFTAGVQAGEFAPRLAA